MPRTYFTLDDFTVDSQTIALAQLPVVGSDLANMIRSAILAVKKDVKLYLKDLEESVEVVLVEKRKNRILSKPRTPDRILP